MSVDLKVLQQKLAEYKVYNACQYVQGLIESMRYMWIRYRTTEKNFGKFKTYY